MAKSLFDDAGNRRHERQLLQRGAALAYRVQDPPDSECYFCDGRDLKDSEEHIIPQWLQDHLDMREELFTPFYRSGFPGASDIERGEIPAKNLVAKGICKTCNSGWMSSLEGRFKSSYLGKRANWVTRDVVEWFVKTAFVLNVSQNNRLLVPRDVRLGLAAGTLDPRLTVYFHTVVRAEKAGGHFNWIQGGQVVSASMPSEWVEAVQAESSGRWTCSIRVENLVGTVIFSPGGWQYECWERPGAVALQDGHLAERMHWSAAPKLSHFHHGSYLLPKRPYDWGALELVPPFPTGLKGTTELTAFLMAHLEVISEASRAPLRHTWNARDGFIDL